MKVSRLVEIGSTPHISAFLGTQGSRRVIDQLNDQLGAGGMYFGSSEDPRANRYAQFQTVYQRMEGTVVDLRQSESYIMGMNEYIPIFSEEQLVAVPPIMQVPILTYAPIRCSYNAGVLEGWNLDIPEEVEDDMGRLINNGLAQPHFDEKGEWVMPDEMVWDSRYGDSDISDEDLDVIDETRRFIAGFIHSEMLGGGERRDPTSAGLEGTIGKLQ